MAETFETEQSILKFKDDWVLKTYKKDHAFFDEKYFNSEVRSLSKLNGSKYIVNCFDISVDKIAQYRMARYDFALGTAPILNLINVCRVLFSMGIDEILDNLDAMLKLLKENCIRHRDINPGNILYSEKERVLKLTDFFWSENTNNRIALPTPTEKHPWPVNGVFGNDDVMAIGKIKKTIKYFYDNYFINKYNEIRDKFISSVGHGNYKDGSSVFDGYSYHVIDMPGFKEAIKYHKNACIDEYKIIKDNIPIKPKTFIDIGAASGYFTFNLIRDYDIEYCRAYEADENVKEFLCGIENFYNLSELDVFDRFDNGSELDIQFDIAIFLNSHMWIYKQLGKDKALECVRNILNNCRYMFFQTCGAYSSGMYKIMEYRKPDDIFDMLYEAGAIDVKTIGRFVGSHDAPRHMFLVKGNV